MNVPIPAHARLRLSAQRALLGCVSPSWREVSVSADEANRQYHLRFVFTTSVTDEEIEDAQAAVTEIMADFPDWKAHEEFQKCNPPEKPGPLDWIAYSRKE